ncbi:hypothetical protein PCI56_27180 [Plesiomonas shigelloides subsp. oncorhynchi]|nr:hypothetical protein [Plesiomonas shigelloides]
MKHLLSAVALSVALISGGAVAAEQPATATVAATQQQQKICCKWLSKAITP